MRSKNLLEIENSKNQNLPKNTNQTAAYIRPAPKNSLRMKIVHIECQICAYRIQLCPYSLGHYYPSVCPKAPKLPNTYSSQLFKFVYYLLLLQVNMCRDLMSQTVNEEEEHGHRRNKRTGPSARTTYRKEEEIPDRKKSTVS